MSDQANARLGRRPKDAAARLGVSVQTHYRKQHTDPDWPRIIRIGTRISLTTDESIDAYIAKKAAAA